MLQGIGPWVRKILWRRTWQPTTVFLPGKSHGQRNPVGYSPCGRRRVTHNLATKQQLESHALRESTVICQLWMTSHHNGDFYCQNKAYPVKYPIILLCLFHAKTCSFLNIISGSHKGYLSYFYKKVHSLFNFSNKVNYKSILCAKCVLDTTLCALRTT